ncbi:MAG: hypothetical protein OEY13_02345 [Gammaproteobacteria bacterium]|nr:hypothetical protein [Gammaproteobacteria bacterium]MDH4310630.1 hypothetical protein [Gammaproteobacteria bacterium]MDH5271896.1 hypothetical protein [Gammaproteobacteria bacterium]
MPNRRERRATPVSLAPLIGLTILAAGLAFAQQNLPVPAPAPAEPTAQEPAAGAEAAGDDAAAAGKAGDEGPAAKPAAAKGSPQRFEPTEKVRPDFDVAFPVDI